MLNYLNRIDFTHPALGGGFGPGYKVAFGRDLVGDYYTPRRNAVPKTIPMDCIGHGTHVAGIIAASNDPFVAGISPAVTLGIYKVFGCNYETEDDILIQAFDEAESAGVDIISASLGAPGGWSEGYVVPC